MNHWKNRISSIAWKYWRKRLENPISIVLSSSVVWTYFPWYGNILEIKLPYCGRGSVFPVNEAQRQQNKQTNASSKSRSFSAPLRFCLLLLLLLLFPPISVECLFIGYDKGQSTYRTTFSWLSREINWTSLVIFLLNCVLFGFKGMRLMAYRHPSRLLRTCSFTEKKNRILWTQFCLRLTRTLHGDAFRFLSVPYDNHVAW